MNAAPRRLDRRRQVPGGWRLTLACVLLGVSAPVAAQSVPPAAAPLLVVPFENTAADGRIHWLTEASAIILTDDLRELGVPVISYEDRMRALERLRIPAVGSLSHATTIRVGQLVGAARAIVGGFSMDGETLTVRARTIGLDAGRISADIAESGPVEDLFGIYARILRQIAPGIDPEQQAALDHPPPAAFEQYVKGLLATVPATRISYLSHARQLAPPGFQRPGLALWSVYHEQGEHGEALAAVEDVPEDHRLYRRAQFLASVSLMHLERDDEAFETLTDLNRAVPDPALLNNLGVIRLRRPAEPGDAPAVSYFGDALRLDGDDGDVMFNLGYAYVLGGEWKSAVAWLREALRRDPADAEAHYVLGAVLETTGNTAEASREKELARRLSTALAQFDSTAAVGRVPQGLERMKADIEVPASLRVAHAIAAAGQRDQREASAYYLAAGRRLFDEARDTEAIAALRRAIYSAPYDSEAHLLLGRLYLRGGRVADAIDALTISVWSHETTAAHLALAEAHLAAGDAAAARAVLEIVLQRDPENAEARRLLDER